MIHPDLLKPNKKLLLYPVMLFSLMIDIQQTLAAAPPEFTDTVPNGIGLDAPGEAAFGGGAAWIDYNNDGYADLFIPTESTTNPAVSPVTPSRLYLNDTDGSFTEVTRSANIDLAGRSCTGAVAGDINNDGFDDLFVTCGMAIRTILPLDEVNEIEKNALLLNNGDGTFTDITDSAGLHNSTNTRHPSYAAAFGDLDGDGDLDLYIGNYVTPVRNCIANQLFINNGDNTFEDRTGELGVGGEGCTLAVTMTDYDMDGDLDIFEINDFAPQGSSPNSMYQNNGPNQAFTNVAIDTGLNASVFGMGVAVGDYDNDEDLDYYITSIGANVLHQDDGAHFFTNAVPTAKVENRVSNPNFPTQLSVSWGTVFFDANNDGLQDLYVANGTNGDFFQYLNCQSATPCLNRLYRNSGKGIFKDITGISGAINVQGIPLGVAVADYDRDGDVDMLVTNSIGLHSLYSNNTDASKKYLQVRLQGVESNRRGIGAKVRVIAGRGKQQIIQLQELHAGSSHSSNHEFMLHFGLGDRSEARQVIVEWPMGCRQVLDFVPAGDTLITEDCTPPHILTGMVTYNGAGLANAVIRDAVRGGVDAVTDAYGIFTIENADPDRQVVLSAAAGETPGLFIHNQFTITTLGQGDSFNNRFEATALPGSVSGYLTTSTGESVSDHPVWDYHSLPEQTTTDVNGLYVLSGFTLDQNILVLSGHDILGTPVSKPGFRFIPRHNGDVYTDFDFVLSDDHISRDIP